MKFFRLPPSDLMVWFGVLGGAVAWLCQFGINLAFSFAQCNAPAGRWHLPIRSLQVGLSAAGVAVGLLSMGMAVWLYLYTYQFNHEAVARMERRGEGSPAPTGRINFLAVVGITVNLLALAIMIMTGIGAPLLTICRQV